MGRMDRYRRHFLVCLTSRPPDAHPSCGARGSAELLARLQKELDRRRLREVGGVAATGSTCFGLCEAGPNVVVYPESTWYGAVAPTDAAELAERHGVSGASVERLLHPDVR